MSNPGETLRQMHAMLDLLAPVGYRVSPKRPSLVTPAAPDGHVVLVTGTTGFLGTGILAKLLESPDVRRIYAINRSAKDGTALEARHRAAFEERGYDPRLIDLPKLLLVETSITERGLGVDSRLEEDYHAYIHNAWRVHFNLPLSTFKPILQGMRVLIDFAMDAPNMQRFVFISSAPIFNNVRDPHIPQQELPLHDGSVAIGSGYLESKWVAEQMLYRTAKDFPAFRPLVVRVGVITGSPNGAWNPMDAVPAIVKSSLHSKMRCLPVYPGMRVLIDFAMDAPNMKRFIFISSAAIFNNVGDPNILVPELSLHDGSVVVRNGYVESKWIAEQMLYRTAKDFTAFRPLVVRVGVVTGSPNGAWSPTDFVPAIVKSSLHSEMRCLPAYPGHCSWVPLDVAARTIIDYLNATENVDTVHLVHPIIQPSVNIMYWIKTITNLPIVPFSEWIGKLKLLASTSGIDYSLHIPAIKLIPFFEDEARSNGFPSLILRNDVALRLSGSLRRAEAVSMVHVASWMSYWAKIGFLPPSVAERARVFLGQGNHPSRL
ncbi:male sterility protein-domain-containing protein [Mucidula mucida]|nr:male sterility protein-domain-containing protein [Mucidula mucida]